MWLLIISATTRDEIVDNLNDIHDAIKNGETWGQIGEYGGWSLSEDEGCDVA